MARNILTDDCGRRALGLVQVASAVLPAAAQRRGRDIGAAHIDAPAWAVAWTSVPVASPVAGVRAEGRPGVTR
ncbi:hypothetical protein [Cryptosporangium sp. NPDC051539]|uniref:hypothetical protein n=1 Tax=Cryptosporangium sp. NPDC051539 TaxID=3363962 RepID=UPI00379A7AF5